MEYVEIPNPLKGPRPWLFLGGGITGCREWQNEVRHALDDFEHGTLINPRRTEWDIGDPGIGEQQIECEFHAIHQCDIFSLWFSSETVQPICMFELGAALTRYRMGDQRNKALVLGVDPEYERRFDVDKQTALALQAVGDPQRNKVWMCHDLNMHIENLKLALTKVWKDSGYARSC
jgi:hypothetical protein